MDPLIGPDEGVTVRETRDLFGALRARLVPLVDAISERPIADDGPLRKSYPEAQQLAFALEIAQAMGYDLARGRLDKTAHPFMTRFDADDVRITTRVKENDLSDALFSTWHETGHALYELGVSRTLSPPLDGGTSAGVHESQSRLWENIVARSRGFWLHMYPRLQRVFPDQLGNVPLDDFYRAINKVERTLIRTDADEVTYNLHIMIRFDLECDLLEGRLRVRDLADAWNARYKADLGIEPASHGDGVLQDVHWYVGGLGGSFQSYTVGNILAAQFYAAALAAHPEIEAEIATGSFETLNAWLRDNIHAHGRKFGVHELVVRATGETMRIEPYMSYLEGKYGELYGLQS
jgi:carboxypeptidase Taq